MSILKKREKTIPIEDPRRLRFASPPLYSSFKIVPTRAGSVVGNCLPTRKSLIKVSNENKKRNL